MLIEQPPRIYRWCFPGSFWRIPSPKGQKKSVYLTFDDGPIPEMTPWILDTLDKYGIKATFFCVGENVCKYPELYRMLTERGHHTGNHTFNHIQGIQFMSKNYIRNIAEASKYIDSDLFRPPHGHMRFSQVLRLRKLFKIIMWDVVTRDYSPHMTAKGVFNNVKRYTRNGSIIVFHDSLKAIGRIEEALPKSIEWLLNEGYEFRLLQP
ncbi:MAG: polysaccharide deacetylase family protein [Tannerella sp.]|jgi:peptidoglycan/xylan/chitin deacetylase (PgdA/CDA1 family)|nr:polysaccharide deacetylase family protein [Tannerella sp.]